MNSQYHDRDYATNVLSFLVELPEEVDSDLLGDLVICAAVVELEAAERVRLWMHTGHLVVHGCPHFLGVRSSAG
jgi:probable rRNA maturation factor